MSGGIEETTRTTSEQVLVVSDELDALRKRVDELESSLKYLSQYLAGFLEETRMRVMEKLGTPESRQREDCERKSDGSPKRWPQDFFAEIGDIE